jgi:diamine N-acetyltransferase
MMTMMMKFDDLSMRAASPDDAEALAAFAAAAFEQTYGAQNDPDDTLAYLTEAFGPKQQHNELADPDLLTCLAEFDGQLVAYAQIHRSSLPPPCVSEVMPIELKRFYVSHEWQGRGAAQRLMDQAKRTARDWGGTALWLSVWERNPRAIAFYVKAGFVEVGTTFFVVGKDRQDDRVMLARLPDEG